MPTSPATAAANSAAASSSGANAAAPSAARPPLHFEPHLQGLRAIAVLLVVIYHFWPGRLTGGYIGVDIFFVISGFLITGQLSRELLSTGRIGLPAFWAKRARRLLPASLLVLAFSTVATFVVLPLSSLHTSLREILASIFYVENWALAASSVNYLASSDESLVQHYWSLSLEEQFYLLWPLLLLAAVWLAARFATNRSRASALLVVIAVVGTLSLAFSVVYTVTNPAEAYFVTFSRMWEFAVGAILALLPRLRPRGALSSNLVGYAGLITVLASGYLFTQQTPFPGYFAVIPVLGTAALIVAARRERWYDIGSVLSGRPQRFIGDISYSLYLWHWPLIIIAPYVPGWGLETANRIALFALCFVLGWLTKRFVEDPARQFRGLTRRRPRTTYLAVLAAMGVSAALVAGVFVVQAPKFEAATAELAAIAENPPACFGAESSTGCSNPELAASVIPGAGFGNADKPGHIECFVQLNQSAVKACHFGSTAPDAPRIALIGDSHAYQFIEAMITLANERGWALTTYLKGACPWTTAAVGGPSPAFIASCADFRDNLAAELAAQPAYDTIFTAALAATPISAGGNAGASGGTSAADVAAAGFADAWSTQAQGAPVITLVDNPDLTDDPNKCLRFGSAQSCAVPRVDVLAERDPIALAAASLAGNAAAGKAAAGGAAAGGAAAGDAAAGGATAADVTLLDFTDTFCDAEQCFVVISGANVYRDQDHLTVTFASTMERFIGDAIEAVLTR